MVLYILLNVFCALMFFISEKQANQLKLDCLAIYQKLKILFLNQNTNVSKHFNLKGHNYLQHLKFFIVIKNCDDKNIRRNYENQFIKIFFNMNRYLLNNEDDLNRKFDLYCTKTFRFT